MENKYNINPCGLCPVQADGVLPTGEPYYFRARGEHWSMAIGENPVDISCGFQEGFRYEEEYKVGEEFAAGYMTEEEAVGFATQAIEKYYSEKQG